MEYFSAVYSLIYFEICSMLTLFILMTSFRPELVFRQIQYVPFEPVHEISNNVVCATSKASDQPAHTRSLIRAFASRLSIL